MDYVCAAEGEELFPDAVFDLEFDGAVDAENFGVVVESERVRRDFFNRRITGLNVVRFLDLEQRRCIDLQPLKVDIFELGQSDLGNFDQIVVVLVRVVDRIFVRVLVIPGPEILHLFLTFENIRRFLVKIRVFESDILKQENRVVSW